MNNDRKLNEQLLDIAYKLSSSLDLQFILNKIIHERTLKLLSTKRATIYLLDSDKESLNPVATLDPTDEAQVMSQKLSVKSSLSGKALKAKKSMIFNNASQYSDAYHIPGTPDDEDENLLVLPLIVEKEILGTLNLYRRNDLYLKEDIEFAEIFALYASVAIKNALEHQRLIREIKERKQAEKMLITSEKKSRIWLEHSPVCTKIVDLDFNLKYMSASGIKDLKIDDITQYYGKPYPFHFYPDSFKIPMIKNLKKVKETGEVITQEASLLSIDGKELWYRSTLVPVNDNNGKLDYIMVVSLHTTEQKQAEQELRASEYLLRESQKVANIGSYKLNIFSGIWESSAILDNIFGLNKKYKKDVTGWLQIVHPEDRDLMQKSNSMDKCGSIRITRICAPKKMF